MEKLFTVCGMIIVGFVFFAVVACLMALPTMLLWNWLAPELFGLKELGFFQAMGMNLLCGILFRGGSSSSSKG